jgi:hypothetical protein
MSVGTTTTEDTMTENQNPGQANIPAPALTREDWLRRAIEEIRPIFEQIGYKLPEKLYVSVGFGSGGGRYESKNVLGVCWTSGCSADGGNHIFISPTIGDTAMAVVVLMHELAHAVNDNRDGHRGEFRDIVSKLGFEAPFTELHVDISLTATAMEIAAVLGEYPHAVLDPTPVRAPVPAPTGEDGPVIVLPRPTSGPKVQENRWVSLRCPVEGHTAPVRMSRTRAAEGAPLCGRRDDNGMPCATEMV